MRQILEYYFEMADREAFEALGFIVLFPLAALIAFASWLRALTSEMREHAGRWLILYALGIMPRRSIVREQTVALLRDRRKYEKYLGWCELTRSIPFSFDQWRKELAWVTWAQKKMQAA